MKNLKILILSVGLGLLALCAVVPATDALIDLSYAAHRSAMTCVDGPHDNGGPCQHLVRLAR